LKDIGILSNIFAMGNFEAKSEEQISTSIIVEGISGSVGARMGQHSIGNNS